jgi:hypothetical protein
MGATDNSGQSSSSHWVTTPSPCSRSYLLAFLRAGAIALILAVFLVAIVLF